MRGAFHGCGVCRFSGPVGIVVEGAAVPRRGARRIDTGCSFAGTCAFGTICASHIRGAGLGQPSAVTTDPSPTAGDEITTRTSYDTTGRVTKQQQPSDAAGTSAGTRITTYWDENTGACTGHPEWGDLVCQTKHAAAITGSTSNTALPNVMTTYNRAGAETVVTRSANGVTSTVSTTFDAALRPASVTTSTGTGGGNAVATQTANYDTTTGQLTTMTAGGKTISVLIDDLGRQLSYTDGTGLRSTR
jgi:hypothetical protein